MTSTPLADLHLSPALVDLDLHPGRFTELPGLRGLRLARLGQYAGKTLEVLEAAKGVVVPALAHPSTETGRVLSGSLRFMQDGVVRDLKAGDTWRVEAGRSQGPHVVLEDGTRVAVLRDGKSALDVV
ncbi:MAG: cupin domain-containing protein [Deltaproteobacteria bacterium]|nr:cupin domain-containing protein [Deltaproteobacteria bacterium]